MPPDWATAEAVAPSTLRTHLQRNIEVMRPTHLNPLFAPVTTLAGIAGKTERLYGKLTGHDTGARVLDLVFHLPIRRCRPAPSAEARHA